MNKSILFIVLLPALLAVAHAEEITSSDKEAMVHVARISRVINLVDKPNIQVNLVVQSFGLATDMSPTQALFFCLFRTTEMFSVDAAFHLGNYHSFKSAERISGGKYKIHVDNRIFEIDAIKAINALQKIDCKEEMDCDEAENFQSSITLMPLSKE
jgi:hypothetical protein